jgi:hypothetical protein
METLESLFTDIPLENAVSAYHGTSFSPEKRGESARQSYASEMAEHYRELSAMCRK